MKIFYIEDNKDTAEAVRILLTNAGLEIKTVDSGKKAIEILSKEYFDLILIDIMLPDISGWDVFEKIKNKTKSKIAFLSAIPVSDERMQELKKSGVSDYITKPFAKQDLIARIKKILEN